MNDLKIVKTSLLKIQDDMKNLSKLTQPSYINAIEQMRSVMEPIRLQQEAIRALTSSFSFKPINEIIAVQQQWQEIVKQVRTKSQIFENLSKVHNSWFEDLSPTLSNINQIQAEAKLSLCNVSYQLVAAEKIFSTIDFDSLKMRFHSDCMDSNDLKYNVSNFMTSFGSLANSMTSLPEIIQQPSFVLPRATRELYTTGYVLKSLNSLDKLNDTDDGSFMLEIEQETSPCIDLLHQVDPDLVPLYRGARDALNGNNPDRSRHILTSLRELWDHILRRLAPNDLVIQWTKENNLKKEEKPTRRSKILYICRGLNQGPLTNFIDNDTRTFVGLWNIFNQLHKLDVEFTDDELRAIVLRTESLLMFILQI